MRDLTKNSEESEKAIEAYLVHRCHDLGLPCLKYTNFTVCGYPDRIVLLPARRVVWVELKSAHRRASTRQKLRHRELLAAGHEVFVIDSRRGVDDLINLIPSLLQ